MKKVFVGCGVLLLLAIGGMAYLFFALQEDFEALEGDWRAASERLARVESDYATVGGSLDLKRFETALVVRADLDDFLVQLRTDTHMTFLDEDLGVIDKMRGVLHVMRPLLDGIAQHLDDAAMAPSEFADHMRLFWATLRRIETGVGGPELLPLSQAYGRLTELYASATKEMEDAPTLDEVIGEFDRSDLEAAETLLAMNVALAERGLDLLMLEVFYMSMPRLTEDATFQELLSSWLIVQPQPVER